jgi:deoxyribonuclease V
MNYRQLHPWDVSPSEAVALQKQLQGEVRVQPLAGPVSLVAGCDVSFDRFSPVIYAGIVVVRLADFAVVDRVAIETTASFPYVPGLLSFRETPALLEAWGQLETRPDAIMLDGHGFAHPRRFGYACHVGLLTEVPALGCAKSVLVGTYDGLGEAAGSTAPLVHRGETIGAAVRTRDRVAPVFASIGDQIDLPSAIDLTLRCVEGYAAGRPRYRIPAPTRFAHLLVNARRRGEPLDQAVPLSA